jgi:alpha/beta superfamily hydrolase
MTSSSTNDATTPSTAQQPADFSAERSEFLLPGPAGALECISDAPAAAEALPATIVLCHPHPQHGGTMHNKVVTIMERSMRELGLRTVRFNYRGVGLSEGAFDDGYGETDDLFAVVEWVRRTRPDDVLWLGGFSFGCSISLRAAQNLQLGQLIHIAPAVRYPAFRELGHPHCPWLVIQGDEDDVVAVEDVRAWVAELDPQPDFLVMERAGHFFHRRLMDLRGLLKNGVSAQLPTPGPTPAPSPGGKPDAAP